MLRTISRLVYVSRPVLWINTIGTAVVGVWLTGDLWRWEALPLLLWLTLPFNLLIYGINDLFDQETDARNPRKGTLEGARIEPREIRPIALGVLLTNGPFIVYFLLALPVSATLWMLLYAGIFVGYSAPPVRFKARPYLDSLSNAAYAFPLVFMPLALGQAPVWPAAIGLMAWSAAKHTFDAVQDIDEDGRAGIRTTAVTLGGAWRGLVERSALGDRDRSLRPGESTRSPGERCYCGWAAPGPATGPEATDRESTVQVLHRFPLHRRDCRRCAACRGDLTRDISLSAKRIVVVGGGIGGLAAAALLGRAGHRVTLLEGNSWLGGKSRRVEIDGQRMDTGPGLVTFPGVWDELLRRYDALGGDDADGTRVADLKLRRMAEVGRYHYRGEVVSLPIPEGHPWHKAWERFAATHGGLGPEVTRLLTADPVDRATLPALRRLLGIYGAKLNTKSYLDGLAWMPEGLKEIVAIHTLNAGVSPRRTPALYASMPAVMAHDGVWVPEGGVYEIVQALERLARQAGVQIRTDEPVKRITSSRVTSVNNEYLADAVVSGLDAGRLALLVNGGKSRSRRLSCSGVAVYGALREDLPADVAAHGVVLPSSPGKLYASLERGEEPEETMAFANYYRPGKVYPNERATLALLLTAPANGREYTLEDPFVSREVDRVSCEIGLPKPATEYFAEHVVLDPRYFGEWGSERGALYGAARPFWMSGPFHRPRYNDRRRPELWRVGASVHPGGGIPAVLGGAMISMNRLLAKLREKKGTR